MKRNYLLLALFLVVAFISLNIKQVNSKIPFPAAGSSGDPFTGATCVQGGCHAGPSQPSTSNLLTLNIGTGNPTTTLNNSFQYTPGQIYNLGFALNSSSGRYGFQIVPLKADSTMAGSFTVSSASTTEIHTLGVQGTATYKQYMGHKSANTTKNWVFKWTAPAAGSGNVTFYYAYNLANADGQATSADVIHNGSVTITEGAGTGIADISTKVADLNIFPNPITNNFGLSFNLIEANQVAAQLYTLDGKLAKELINEKMSGGAFNQQFDIAEFPAGIYLVKINVGDASVSKKIIKL
jgi:hypothetical protein